MKELEIKSCGRVISKIFAGAVTSEVVGCFEGTETVYIVCDRKVERLAGSIASSITAFGINHSCTLHVAGLVPIDVSEDLKTMETVLRINDRLLEMNADRNSFLLAIGGGITTDLAGFAASIYKRGIRFAFVPTTLLAQVDAAIGGKNGVNFNSYKNMLGVIRQPEFTYLSPQPLETLSQRDFVSGEAELLKTFIIENDLENDNYVSAVCVFSSIHESSDISEAIRTHSAKLQELIFAAAAVKAGIVSRDQYEKGERKKLNLGHTFAHAVEWMAHSGRSEKDISHGEAVAIGIIQAAKLSERTGLAEQGLAAGLETDFRKCGLPVDLPFPIDSLAGAMAKDKKAEGGKIHFVLIKCIGSVLIYDLPVEEAVKILDRK
jgi:3-dehydroquinate synthase